MTYIPPTEEQKLLDSSGSVINPATEETVILLKRIVKLLDSNAVVDVANRQRVITESGSVSTVSIAATQTLATVTTVSTVTSVTNQVAFGGVDGRFQFMELARISYSNGIRSRLSFS